MRRARRLLIALLLASWPARGAADERGRRLRRAGIGVSVAAIATEVATIALWGAVVDIIADSHSRYGDYHPDPPAYWPLFGLAVGTSAAAPILLGVGIPLWSVGARRAGD